MKKLTQWVLIILLVFCAGEGAFIASLALSNPVVSPPPPLTTSSGPTSSKEGDAELVYLLVKLELNTRAVIAGHYDRGQSSVPGVNFIYKRWLAKNTILPAAVADRIYSQVVPDATGGRAWVKMVVPEPRNPHNQGDSVALEMLEEIRKGAKMSERSSGGAVYYAEPIVANETCLPCHGSPRGEPDPLFSQYKKDGWSAGEVVGAVVARVAPKR